MRRINVSKVVKRISARAYTLTGSSQNNRQVQPSDSSDRGQTARKVAASSSSFSRAAGWGWNGLAGRHVAERHLEAVIKESTSKNKIERVRLLMRQDARPWNVFQRFSHSGSLLKDEECTKLLLWTAAIVVLEKNQGRKVHAIQMGHEMFAEMQRVHKVGISSVMAFYRLCEVSRDITTAFEFFTGFTQKNWPTISDGMPQTSNIRQKERHSTTSSAKATKTIGPFRRSFTPEVLLHLVFLLRIVSLQPDDSKVEEIAQIVKNLYDNQDLALFGALSEAPISESHREELVRESSLSGNGAAPTAVCMQLQGLRTMYTGGSSSAIHSHHLEIFSLLYKLRPRIDLVVKMDPDADPQVMPWIDDCCTSLGVKTENSGATRHFQTGRWIVNTRCPSEQRLPQAGATFPHLEGGLNQGFNPSSTSLVLDPPSWDRPYLVDSLLRDDIIEQLEALAFSFTSNDTDHGRPRTENGSVINPALREILVSQPPSKRFTLLAELASRVKEQLAKLGEAHLEWLEKKTGLKSGDEASDLKPFAAEKQLRERHVSKELKKKSRDGGSHRLLDQKTSDKMDSAFAAKYPIPLGMIVSGVWRLPASLSNPDDSPVLYLAAMATAGAECNGVCDATSLIQTPKNDSKNMATIRTGHDQNLTMFVNSVNIHGAMTAELYHYLLVALAQYAPASAVSMLKKLKASGIVILGTTRATVLASLVRAVAKENTARDQAAVADEATLVGRHVGRYLQDTANPIVSMVMELFTDQLAVLRERAAYERDQATTRAVTAYWAYNYPQLLEERNTFESRKDFYAFLLPAIGVTNLMDMILASEEHKKISKGQKNIADGTVEKVLAVEEEVLVEVRNSLPIIDDEFARAISTYLIDILSGKVGLHPSDSSAVGSTGVVDDVLDLITTRLPKLDIALLGNIPHFESFSLPATGPLSSIATSLGELKEKLTSINAPRGQMEEEGARVQPLYLLDASFLENKDHVSTLLGIIASHRKANQSSASTITSPPILLAPQSSLSDLADTAKGYGRDIFLDATTVLDGMADTRRLQEQSEATHASTIQSKFDAPTSEMNSALEALAGVSKLAKKVPNHVIILHHTEMCLAYHTNLPFDVVENSDVALLRMAALLNSLGADKKSTVQFRVHLCSDDPLFILRVKREAPLRLLSAGVHFLSTSPLVSGLLRDGSKDAKQQEANLSEYYNAKSRVAGDEPQVATQVAEPIVHHDRSDASHSHISNWSEDCSDIIGSIPTGDDIEVNLLDRPASPVPEEELNAVNESSIRTTVTKQRSEATVVEYSAENWMDLLEDDEDSDNTIAASASSVTPSTIQVESADDSDMPQDKVPSSVRIIGDEAKTRNEADELVRQLVASDSAEAVELGKVFLNQRSKTAAIKSEMGMQADAATLAIKGGVDASFYNLFDSSRTVASSEFLTLEQQEHVYLQKNLQQYGAGGLKRALRKGSMASGVGAKSNASDILGMGGAAGPGSGVAFNETEEKDLEREDARRARRNEERWSNRPLVQDHLANMQPGFNDRRNTSRSIGKYLHMPVAGNNFQMYEANINDPRNARLVEAYKQQQGRLVNRKIEKTLQQDRAPEGDDR